IIAIANGLCSGGTNAEIATRPIKATMKIMKPQMTKVVAWRNVYRPARAAAIAETMEYGTVINPTETGSWPSPCRLNSVITRNIADLAANNSVVITATWRYAENENSVKPNARARPEARYRFSDRTNATAVMAPKGRKNHRMGASQEPVVSTNGSITNNTELANNATPNRSRSAGPALG